MKPCEGKHATLPHEHSFARCLCYGGATHWRAGYAYGFETMQKPERLRTNRLSPTQCLFVRFRGFGKHTHTQISRNGQNCFCDSRCMVKHETTGGKTRNLTKKHREQEYGTSAVSLGWPYGCPLGWCFVQQGHRRGGFANSLGGNMCRCR